MASSVQRIRQLVILDPSITIDDLIIKLDKDGLRASRMLVAATREATRDVLRILIRMKRLDSMEL
jgi:hypothetical protein